MKDWRAIGDELFAEMRLELSRFRRGVADGTADVTLHLPGLRMALKPSRKSSPEFADAISDFYEEAVRHC